MDERACPPLHPVDFEFWVLRMHDWKKFQKDKIDLYLEGRDGLDEERKQMESREQKANTKCLGDFGIF